MDGGTNDAKVKQIDFKERKSFAHYSSIITEIWKDKHSAIMIFFLNSAESVLWCYIIIYETLFEALCIEILWRYKKLPCIEALDTNLRLLMIQAWWFKPSECIYNSSNNQNISPIFNGMVQILILLGKASSKNEDLRKTTFFFNQKTSVEMILKSHRLCTGTYLFT